MKYWRRRGWLRAVAYDDKGDCLYERVRKNPPIKYKWKTRNYAKGTTQISKDVQCET